MNNPRLRGLIASARADAPSDARRARVRAALDLRFGAPVPSPGAPRPAPLSTAGTAPGVTAKLLAPLALAGAIGLGAGFLAGRPSDDPPAFARHGVEAQALRRVRAATEPRGGLMQAPPPPVETSAPPPPAVPSAAPAKVTRVDAPAPAVPSAENASARPSATSHLIEETAMLREAQISLRGGDPAAALARLDELATRYPDGMLREERLAARILALCAAGRGGEARREADRFLAAQPESIQARRIRASCAFSAKP